MHFTRATSAILATFAFSSAVFAGVLKAADSFCNSSAGCVWENPASWPGVFECSCNLDAPDANSKLLLRAYTGWTFTGFVMNAYGTPGECINMPALFDRNTESMEINAEATPGCWLYTVPDCPSNADYAVIDKNNIAELEGIYDHGVRSVICDPLTS